MACIVIYEIVTTTNPEILNISYNLTHPSRNSEILIFVVIHGAAVEAGQHLSAFLGHFF
jgi:hypothetical protein